MGDLKVTVSRAGSMGDSRFYEARVFVGVESTPAAYVTDAIALVERAARDESDGRGERTEFAPARVEVQWGRLYVVATFATLSPMES